MNVKRSVIRAERLESAPCLVFLKHPFVVKNIAMRYVVGKDG